MKYKCCIFDLDGTLVNSIHSLVYCTNQALKRCGVEQEVNETQMMTIVGDGYKTQMRRSLIACGDTELVHYEEILPVYMEIFEKHCLYEMHAYEGIPDLLEKVKSLGMKIAVVTNKPHAQAMAAVEHVFGKDYFDMIVGEREGTPKKPDPAMALIAAKALGADPKECLYFGDTNTDMKTGKAAGMTTVAVLWGFRGREELEQFEPDYMIETPASLDFE